MSGFNMKNYFIVSSLLLLFSCNEKSTYREIALNKSILKEIKDERINSKKAGVYIVSLFIDKGENFCEIVRFNEVLAASNFKGCQILEKDTIFLYTENNKFSNCYKFLDRKISFVKREPIIGSKEIVGYYKVDSLNCRILKKIHR